jgi:hypothetical protein
MSAGDGNRDRVIPLPDVEAVRTVPRQVDLHDAGICQHPARCRPNRPRDQAEQPHRAA